MLQWQHTQVLHQTPSLTDEYMVGLCLDMTVQNGAAFAQLPNSCPPVWYAQEACTATLQPAAL
jgi:hypothetical protein